MGKPNLDDYVEVSERITLFREKFPEGTLQAEVIRWPEDGFPFIVVKGYAYRTSDDERPGIGTVSEPYPGRTPFTKDSEVAVAETSAWGRAIVAVGAADTKRGIASADEVRARKSSGDSQTGEGEGPTVSPVQGGDEAVRAAASPPDSSSKCDHEWTPAPREGWQKCTKCGTAEKRAA